MKIRTGCLWIISPVLLVSCYTPRYMYSPAAQNVPVLVKKGDSKLSAGFSTDFSTPPLEGNSNGTEKKNNGFDVQGAVAVTGNIALQLNYFNRKERNGGENGYADSAVINYSRQLTEIGIGYFRSLTVRNSVLFQVFGGAGKGKFSLTDRGRIRNDTIYNSYTKMHQTDITKFYIQPAIIFRPRDNFSLSISTRLSIIRYGNIKTNYNDAELRNYKMHDLGQGAFTFWEPAFTNTFGFKKLPGFQFEYQLGFSELLSNRLINHRTFNFCLSLVLDLPRLLRGQSGGDKNERP